MSQSIDVDEQESVSLVSRGKENREPNVPRRTVHRRRGQQRRHWVFTSHSTEEGKLFQAITGGLGALDVSVRYIIFQKEKGATGGNEHFQGYVEFSRGYRLNQVRRLIDNGAHFEPRRGTQEEAIAYCRKPDTRIEGPWSFGEPSKGKGSRTDLESFRDAIKSGKRKKDLYESHPQQIARYPKFYEGFRDVLQEEGWREIEVILLVGETGLGKTRWVYKNWNKGSFWRLPIVFTTMWFDGYDGQEYALIDEFAGRFSKVSLTVLLQILDGYFVKTPIKHGFTWFGPKHIAVTTNLEPHKWYNWKGRETQYMALARRFTKIMQFVNEDVFEYTHQEYFNKDDVLY